MIRKKVGGTQRGQFTSNDGISFGYDDAEENSDVSSFSSPENNENEVIDAFRFGDRKYTDEREDFNDRPGFGETRGNYVERGFDRPTYEERQNYSDRNGYNDRSGYGDRGGYNDRGGYGERNGYGARGNYGGNFRQNYGNRGNYSDRNGNYGDRNGNYGDRSGDYGDRAGYNDRNGYGERTYGGYSSNFRTGRAMRPRMNKMRTSNDPIIAADPFKSENGEEVGEISISGILELHPNGYGFLRDPAVTYTRQLIDPFVPGNIIEHFGLREGVFCTGTMIPGRKNQGPRLKELLTVEGEAPEEYLKVRCFDELTAVTPDTWYKLETGQEPISTRVMDLLTPLGRGQRALIVAPPRTGKTILMQQISAAISTNYPDVKLFVLLIDERPEEVTDMRRAVKGEVVASSLDRDIESHVRLSQLIIERCKRLAERGEHVFLLLDSITRLARAFNKWVGNTGRTMSGGVDIKAMDIPKKLFATARQFEEGGSLTIIGTALIDTGSRMDELIFQEFKGTGNMELVLDRKLADRRIWPAMDISMSGTRREEKLLPPDTLHAVTLLRRTLASMNPIDAMEQLTQKLGKRKSNQEFINQIMGSSSRFD